MLRRLPREAGPRYGLIRTTGGNSAFGGRCALGGCYRGRVVSNLLLAHCRNRHADRRTLRAPALNGLVQAHQSAWSEDFASACHY